MTNSHALRSLITAIALLVPVSALAVPNNSGTPQNACERAATSDYNANYENCKTYLAGDNQSIAQCQQDASYDYLDAIAACKAKSSATLGTKGGTHGKFDGVLDTQTTSPQVNASFRKPNAVFAKF